MKNLKINIDYGRPEPKTDEEKKAFLTNSELTADYINYATRTKYGDGLKGLNLRTFGRIQRKLDKAIDEGKDEVVLENSEFDLIKSVFTEEVGFPAQLAKYVTMLIDEIEVLGKDTESNKEENEK